MSRLASLPEGMSIQPWPEAPPPTGPNDYGECAGYAPNRGEVATAARFRLEDWNDVDFDPNEEWRIEDVLPMRGFGLIYGKPRSFKSFVVTDFSAHVATGSLWAGRRVAQTAVVYIAAEGAAGLRKRITALKARHEIPRGQFALISDAPNLGTGPGDLPDPIRAVESAGISPGVIVVDTASKSIGAAEENGTGMAAFVGNAERLARHFDCLVLGVHHVGLGDDVSPLTLFEGAVAVF